MEIRLKFEINDVQLLQSLYNQAGRLLAECEGVAAPKIEGAAVVVPAAAEFVPADPAEVPFEAPAAAAAPAAAPAKTYTLDEVRKAVMNKSRTSDAMKASVKALLNEYAASVPALDPAKYAEFMSRLEALS